LSFRNTIINSVAAYVLTIALLSPVLIQCLHSFENHEYKACKEVSSHLHKKKANCTICSFHLSSFEYNIPNNSDFSVFTDFFKSEIIYISSEKTVPVFHQFLRGPPLLS